MGRMRVDRGGGKQGSCGRALLLEAIGGCGSSIGGLCVYFLRRLLYGMCISWGSGVAIAVESSSLSNYGASRD